MLLSLWSRWVEGEEEVEDEVMIRDEQEDLGDGCDALDEELEAVFTWREAFFESG